MTGGGNMLPSSRARLPSSRSAPRLRLGPRGSILHVSHPWQLGALSSPAPHGSGGPRGLGPHVPRVPTPQLCSDLRTPSWRGICLALLTHLPCAGHQSWPAPSLLQRGSQMAGHSQDPSPGPLGALQLPASWRTPCPEAGLPSLGLADGETEARQRARPSQHPGCHVFLGHLLLGEDGLGWLSEGLGSPWGDPTQGAKPGAISPAPLHGGPLTTRLLKPRSPSPQPALQSSLH